MKTTVLALGMALLGLTSISLGQEDTTWGKWNWLIGDWVGEGSGTPGQGGGWFSLHPDLNGNILVRKGHAEYPATNDKPKIVHDDVTIVYLDGAGHPNNAIYFDNERHVINYDVTYSENSITCTSGKVTGMPVFRLTYVLIDKETIRLQFAMSQDGEIFRTYTEGICKKRK
jgi:hypothetical protein